MAPSDQQHDCIVRHLSAAPTFCKLRLVARLQDPKIGNPNDTTAHIFVPDMHLVSNTWLLHYSYHFNEQNSFYRMLFRLRAAGDEIRAQGGQMSTIQLGDLFDLWRDGDAPNPDRIINDYQNTVQMLCTHPAGLQARVLVGNHDVGMFGSPNWSLRLFLPDEVAGAFGLVLHGDWFDTLLHDILPDWLQKAGLLLGSRIPSAHDYPIATLRDAIKKESDNAGGFASHIMLKEPGATPAMQGASASAELPAEVNVARASKAQKLHEFMPHARALVELMRKSPTADVASIWKTTRLVVVGHTHQPRISVDDSDPNNPLIMVDCGAWIEKYQEQGGAPKPNCQLGVLVGNDVRIYQLDPV